MELLEQQFESQRALFPWGYNSSFRCQASLTADSLNRLTGLFLQSKYLLELQNLRELTNLRGRDNGEVLYVSGNFIVDQEEAEEAPDTEFSISLISEYKSSNARQVVHTLHEIRSGNCPATVGLRHLPDRIPAQIEVLRFSLNKYSPRKVSGYFGLAPITTGYFLLECTQSDLHLNIREEGLAVRDQFPWAGHPALESLSIALESPLGTQ